MYITSHRSTCANAAHVSIETTYVSDVAIDDINATTNVEIAKKYTRPLPTQEETHLRWLPRPSLLSTRALSHGIVRGAAASRRVWLERHGALHALHGAELPLQEVLGHLRHVVPAKEVAQQRTQRAHSQLRALRFALDAHCDRAVENPEHGWVFAQRLLSYFHVDVDPVQEAQRHVLELHIHPQLSRVVFLRHHPELAQTSHTGMLDATDP
eukprot:2469225-Rhodomonas_salina.1